MSNVRPRPIIIVTGASGIGIGFGICHRLLLQLSRSQSADSLPRPELSSIYSVKGTDDISLGICDGLTLILACRSFSRAQLARDQLLHLLDDDIAKQRRHSNYDGHADIFRKNLEIDIQLLDLTSLSSIFKFGEEITAKYPYISHLIFNAAATTMCGMQWRLVPAEMLRNFIEAVTRPRFYKQTKGVLSVDGFGWVWQCNVFGNYCVLRLLESLLLKYFQMHSYCARVIWVSSLDIHNEHFDIDDWQLINHDLPYQASKYEVDLLVGYLERKSVEKSATSLSEKRIRAEFGIKHIISQPGVLSTNLQRTIIGFWLMQLMRISFIMASLFGSLNHHRDTYQASFSTVYAALAPIPSHPPESPEGMSDVSIIKYHTQSNFWGWEGLRAEVISKNQNYWKYSIRLGIKCETLFQSVLQEQNRAHKQSL